LVPLYIAFFVSFLLILLFLRPFSYASLSVEERIAGLRNMGERMR
jgi:hypothetical protein